MTVYRPASGRTLMAAPGRPLLYKPIRGGSVYVPPAMTGGWTGTLPSAVAGLSGWWDAGAPTSLLDATGAALSDFGSAVASAADKSGAGSALTVFHYASTGTVAPVATPRVAGLLGGLGASTVTPPTVPAGGVYLPSLQADNGLALASAQMGSGSAWTRYLVWTRPNYRQSGLTAAITLLTAGTTKVLTADSTAASSKLILFPGASQTILTSALERRHTHSIILRNTPGVGVDVWLDGTQVATAAPNPMASSATARLLFLHDGTASGGAQCWFHEAATWERALSSAEIATLLSAALRWPRGARKGVTIVPIGQSNAGNALNDGAWHLLAQGIAWHLGAAAYGVIGKYGSSGSSTIIGGHGLYGGSEASFSGSFLTYQAGVDPSAWALGADGTGVETYLSGFTADQGDIAALLFPYSETDSIRPYSELALYKGAVKQFISIMRAYLGRTAAQLPVLWWNAIPFAYSNNGGMQMQREAIAGLASDASQNVVVAMRQTSDSNSRGATWNATTGAQSGGDVLHRDAPDNIAFGRRGANLAARAILAAGGGDTLTAFPSGYPAAGGPKIASAQLTTGTTVLVTITHDGGTDLVVPLLAANGQGWAVMNGGSVATPGTIVLATACVRTSATTLTLTLASSIATPAVNCLLFYPYGFTAIGRGNAVTDNYASVTKPSGWDIGHDLGSAWNLNQPVQATGLPVVMT